MAKYKYNALKDNKQIIEGFVEASSPREARNKIRELGFLPTKIYTEEANLTKKTIDNEQVHKEFKNFQIKRLSLDEKIAFTLELQTLLDAGIPIVEALLTLEKHSPGKKIKIICNNVRLSIEAGFTFSKAISMYEHIFGNVFIALVKTGEDAGELRNTLMRMVILLQKQDNIKRKIISASIYPIILIVMILGLTILFGKCIFPNLLGMMNVAQVDLPFMAQQLVDTVNFINNFWWFIIIFVCAMIAGFTALLKNEIFKSAWDKFILNVPKVSDFIQYINLANFMHLCNIAYEAGVNIFSTVELSSGTVGNTVIKKRFLKSLTLIKNGKTLADSFATTNALPQTFNSMIATGEKTGSLGKMFSDIADAIDKKVDMTLDALTRMFEPTVIIVMAVMVGFAAIGMYQLYITSLSSMF